MSAAHPSQWVQLWAWRARVFVREPGVLFWVFGFPLLLAMALGIAFRNRGPERAPVLVGVPGDLSHEAAEKTAKALAESPLLDVRTVSADEADRRYRRGEALAVVIPGDPPTIRFDRSRPGAPAAAAAVEDALEANAGRRNLLEVRRDDVSVPGRRYVDFLIPGLLGMSLLSGGVWGVGYELVSQRVKRLLKRMAATPMSRPAFLGSFLMHRLVVALLESALLLGFGAAAFDVQIHGSWLAVLFVVLLGAAVFGGFGLFLASRARNMETANGLINLGTLPMWLLSGVFFSTSNFPDWMRPAVNALPLTALNDALRAVMNDGATLLDTTPQLLVLLAWGVVSFLLALRWFRWQ